MFGATCQDLVLGVDVEPEPRLVTMLSRFDQRIEAKQLNPGAKMDDLGA